MKKLKTSPIWKLSKEEFQKLLSSCATLADVLRYYDLHSSGGNYPTLKRRIKEDNIDISHMSLGLGNCRGKTFTKRKPIEEFFVLNSIIGGDKLKKDYLKKKY